MHEISNHRLLQSEPNEKRFSKWQIIVKIIYLKTIKQRHHKTKQSLCIFGLRTSALRIAEKMATINNFLVVELTYFHPTSDHQFHPSQSRLICLMFADHLKANCRLDPHS